MKEIVKEVIEDQSQILAVILRNGDFPEGLNFHTKDGDFLQVATWRHAKGKRSTAHAHQIVARTTNLTQELIYIKEGRAKAEIYSKDDKFLKEVILNAGDMIIILAGGHCFETLVNGTQVIEVKNGPYLGPEKDKRNLNV